MRVPFSVVLSRFLVVVVVSIPWKSVESGGYNKSESDTGLSVEDRQVATKTPLSCGSGKDCCGHP